MAPACATVVRRPDKRYRYPTPWLVCYESRVLRRWRLCPLLALALLFAAAPALEVRAATCGEICRDRAGTFGWSKKVLKGCVRVCKRDQKQCSGAAAARRECRQDSAECSLECAEVWGDPADKKDRSFCQTVCGSCKREGRGFCVDGLGSASDDIARCCGGPGEGSCCTSGAFPVTPQCCPGGNTCCPAQGCVNTRTDSLNCGACGFACPDGYVCDASACALAECCPRPCTETTPPNTGVRTVVYTLTNVPAGAPAQVTQVTGRYDPCGARDGTNNCVPVTTLVCTFIGAEIPCDAQHAAIFNQPAVQSLLHVGGYCAFTVPGVLCVADGRSCEVTFGDEGGSSTRSIACDNCGDHGPACAGETWGDCTCPITGVPSCPPRCTGAACS